MKTTLSDQQEKIRELLYGEPKEKLLALLLMKDWTLGEICSFLDRIRKVGTWRNTECTLIVLSLFSEKLVDPCAWRGWDTLRSYSALSWNRNYVPDKMGVLSPAQVAYGHNRNVVNWMFEGVIIGKSVDPFLDLFKEVE